MSGTILIPVNILTYLILITIIPKLRLLPKVILLGNGGVCDSPNCTASQDFLKAYDYLHGTSAV